MADSLSNRTFRALGDASASARTIFTGSGIIKHICIANTAAADDLVNFTNSAGTILFSINAPADDSATWDPDVVLDAGLIAVSVGGAATTIISATFRPQ